jgi:transposase
VKVTKEEFIRVWSASTSRAEVVTKTGLSTRTVARYAWKFRKNGVALKHLKEERPCKTNWGELSDLCETLNETHGV